jgi:hypothetical protein
MIIMFVISVVNMVVTMRTLVMVKRIIVLHGRRKPRAYGQGRLLRWPNRGPTAFTPSPVPALVGSRGFGATSSFVVRWIDGVTASVAVTTLRNIRDDQFVIDTAPEWPALRLSLFDSTLACHHTGARSARTIGCR